MNFLWTGKIFIRKLFRLSASILLFVSQLQTSHPLLFLFLPFARLLQTVIFLSLIVLFLQAWEPVAPAGGPGRLWNVHLRLNLKGASARLASILLLPARFPRAILFLLHQAGPRRGRRRVQGFPSRIHSS